jgi:hypothetical protein
MVELVKGCWESGSVPLIGRYTLPADRSPHPYMDGFHEWGAFMEPANRVGEVLVSVW